VSLAFFHSPNRVEALARAMPFGLFLFVLALRSLSVDTGSEDLTGAASGFDLRWLYAAQAALACAALILWRPFYKELLIRPGSMPALVTSVVVGIFVFLVWILPMPSWALLGSEGVSFVPLDASGGLRWDLIVARSFGALLVVPVMEELFWRSFVMRFLDRRDFLALAPGRASWTGVLVSSAIFATEHELWLAGLVAGLAYALIYRRFGNLWYPILAHAVTNGALAAWVVSQQAWSYW
jgi:CAAX prenyl protease-like protein